MVVDLPISESSAYEAGPTIDKAHKEKETNKDKRSVKLENVGDIPDYKNTGKGKIDQEENNNKSQTSFAISSPIPVLENTDKSTRDKSNISKVKTDKVLLIKETSICISNSHHNTSTTTQKEKDFKKDIVAGSTAIIPKSNDIRKENDNECMNNDTKSTNQEKSSTQTYKNEHKSNESITPGTNCNAPLFIPSKYLSERPPENTVYAMKEPCIYYPTYSSYYDSPRSISYNYSRPNSENADTIDQKSVVEPSEKLLMHKHENAIDNVDKQKDSTESQENCVMEEEDKSSSDEQLSVIEPNNVPSESHCKKITPLKEGTSELAETSVECFTTSQYESQETDTNGNSEIQDSYNLSNTTDATFLPSHPMLSPITGNHGDLFINPAFAAEALQAHGLVHPDPQSFMNFLPNGNLVGPMGEIYCPPPDYYIMDQNGDIPPGLVSPPQGSSFDGPATIRMVSTNSTPPMPLPMQVPPGHMVQQVVDQTGTLLHVILSPDPMSMGPGPQPAAPGQPTPLQGTPLPSGGSTTPGGSNNGGAGSGGATTPASAPSSIIQTASTGNGGSTTPQPQFGMPMTPLYPSGPSNGPHGPLPPSCPGPRQPFTGSTQYGPPPGAPILPPVTGSHTPTPSSHGASPTPSSGSGGGSAHMVSGGHPPGYPAYHTGPDGRRPYKPKPRTRNQPPSSLLAAPSASTPPQSPRKPRDFRGPRDSGNNIVPPSPSSKGKGDSPLQNPDDPISDESGVGHEEEEAELLLELLSNIRTPKVSEIQATSALLKWGPPVREDSKFEGLDHITDKLFRYEVLLSDKGRDGKYRSIFTGHSIECRLTDLRPWTEYHIRIHALYEALKGGSSDTVTFCTDACEPDQPAPPKLQNRTKTALSLRWNAPSDNGAHILHYILESDEGRGLPYGAPEKYTEISKGRAKSFNITKLQSSTSYRFRLHAVNELGRSRPSEVVTYTTQGTAPMQPQPPGLKEATKSSLHLVWSKRLSDIEFVLHMDDRISGHGYLPVYTGTEMQHICNGLRRNASYKFRLQAHNEEGKSPWSDEVWYETLPDRPGPPLRPASKGRLHSNSFKVRWDCPSDDGGSPITNYILEIDDSRGWQTVYRGSDLECICDNLRPGTQYKVRVACTSSGGVSDFSDICHICTEPVNPGQCAPPRPHGKPKATSLHLKWGWPETDGGSEVTEFEIDMTSPDNTTLAVYRGHDTECTVASLMPGRPYLFQVRAHNRAGSGPWSESLEVVSGAGSPDQPKPPGVSCRSSTVAHVEWECPINNGAIISEFTLQMAIIATRKCLSPPPSHSRNLSRPGQQTRSSSMSSNESLEDEDDYGEEEDEDDEDEEQQSDDESLDSEHEDEDEDKERHHKKVHHLRKRKKKENRNADSNDSDSDDEADDGYIPSNDRDQTSDKEFNNGEPEEVTELENVIEELVKEPEFHTFYTGSQSSFEARNLDPATTYLIRVCATNSAGTSDWSESSQAITPAAPPASVSGLYLRSSTATSLTLAWERPTANGENITHYNVDNVGLAVVPTPGPDNFFVIDRLKPDTPYTLRVQAVNSVGPGPFSHPATKMSTRPLPPAPPKCELVNANHNSLKLKWGDSKSAATTDLCHYTLEMENSRNQFHTTYSGTGVSYKIAKLSENRIYKVRLYASNEAGQGPYSQLYEFKTAYAHPPPLKAAPRVTGITEDGCLVEWSPVKMLPLQGELHYRVQLTKVRESDAKIIYTGHDTQFRVNGLDPKTEYSIRVGGVRVPVPGGIEMSGTFSPPGIFTTAPSSSPVNPDQPLEGQRKITTSRTGFLPHKGDKAWTDQQWACVILVGFTVFALCVAMFMQQVIAWGFVSSQ